MKKALIVGICASLVAACAGVAPTSSLQTTSAQTTSAQTPPAQTAPAAPRTGAPATTTPATTAAPATPPAPPARRIEAALAKEAVETAIATCTSQNLKISAAVADAAGLPVYVYVPDGVRNGTGDTAIRKALTMAITGKPASETAALAAADPALEAKLAANPRTVRFPGGVPLKAGDTIVGFIAGSGATGAQDEACAKAGADKIAARIR